MRQIAFFSQKGGCGKTTACVNIAAALGGLGRRVLVIDLDSNACASRTFGVLETLENSIAAALLGLRSLASVVIDTAVPNVWLAPGATDLYTLDDADGVRDASRLDASGRLSPIVLNLELARLDPAQFDYVLLDCAGGHPFIAHLALLACDEVIIPTGLAVYDLYAATPAMHLILMAREARGDDKPDFLGFLPNGAGRQGVPGRIQAKLDQYALPCLPAIRHSELLKTLAGAQEIAKRFVVLSRPNTAVAASFQQAARQIDSGAVEEPTIDSVEPVDVGDFAVAASAENGSTATAIDSAVL
ncbi:MAG: ParA family protein [Anaerolineales bacterium]|nr:ParA family protein [Anaerolineales bacterium]